MFRLTQELLIAIVVLLFSGCVEVSNTYTLHDGNIRPQNAEEMIPVALKCEYGDFEIIAAREGVRFSRVAVEKFMRDSNLVVKPDARMRMVLVQHGFSRKQSLSAWIGYWLFTGTVMTRSEAAYPMSIKVYDSVKGNVILDDEIINDGVIWTAHLPILGSLDELCFYRTPGPEYFLSWMKSYIGSASKKIHEYVKQNPDSLIKGGRRPVDMRRTTCYGTGWFVNSNHIVTCAHVIEGAGSLWFSDSAGTRHALRKKAIDMANDVAILECSDFQSKCFLPLGDRRVNMADKVFTIGYPMPTVLGEGQKYSEGVISAMSGIKDAGNVYQNSIPIQPGNSGGALISQDGVVLGIVSSALSAKWTLKHQGVVPQNINYAVKGGYVKLLLDENVIQYSNVKNGSKTSPIDIARESTVMIVAEKEWR